MKSGDPPLSAIAAITTALLAMLATRICLRPMRSERWPATGAAANPAACRTNRQAPTQAGEYPIALARDTGRKVRSAACVIVRNDEPTQSSASDRLRRSGPRPAAYLRNDWPFVPL